MKQPFESVVSEHAQTVLRVCRVVVGADDADDAWSETFLAAMGAYDALPADANVQAWLVTIAHRKAIDILRARQRHAVPVENVPEQPFTAEVDRHDPWPDVRTLPPRQRQAIAYHYLVGLPYAEIATILGGTSAAARKAASDGIKSLRSSMAGTPSTGASR